MKHLSKDIHTCLLADSDRYSASWMETDQNDESLTRKGMSV